MSWPVPANPDLEAHLWAQLKALDGVTMQAIAATPADGLPWLVRYTVQVDARHGSKAEAWRRAEDARRVLWAIAAAPWDEGSITYVQLVEGPAWLPDDDGQPRYMMRADIGARPRDRQGPPPDEATAPRRRVGRK